MDAQQRYAEGLRWLKAATDQPNSERATAYAAVATAHFAAIAAAEVAVRMPDLPTTLDHPIDPFYGAQR